MKRKYPTFRLNGEKINAKDAKGNETLLNWLRRKRRLTGTKEGCAEGDCGACSLIIVDEILDQNNSKQRRFRAINSCLTLLWQLEGKEIWTVEAFANARKMDADSDAVLRQLHPTQRAMVENFGSQCGYCTPGFIASLFELYYRKDSPDKTQIADALCGNLCRCTGYRPIRSAALQALAERKKLGIDNFDLELSKKKFTGEAIHKIKRKGYTLFKARNIKDIWQARKKFPAAPLLVGATELAVLINKRNVRFHQLIDINEVEELKKISRMQNTDGTHFWRIGAAATLTALEEALDAEKIDFAPLRKLLRLFASRQIRNRASMGGNLATASPIGDCAPLALALDAKLILAKKDGERELPISDFFVSYRKTKLAKDEIIKEIILPEAKADEKIEFYKISKRHEMDISIVSAAFRIKVDEDNRIIDARLAYGGVAEIPKRARSVEKLIIGREFSAEDLGGEEILTALDAEFQPIDDARSSKEYRSFLIKCLWQKFVNGEKAECVDDFSAWSSWREIKTQGNYEKLDTSKLLVHDSAIGHVTGEAKYVYDEALQEEMLEIWPVLSTISKGKIISANYEKALAHPGVVAILRAEDVSGINDIGHMRFDEPIFAEGKIEYHSQPIAAIIATSIEAARAAADLVEIKYKQEKATLTIKEALAKQDFHSERHTLARGNFAKVWQNSNAKFRFKGELEIGGQEHFYLESHASWAKVGDAGDFFICSSTQHPSEIQAIVARALGIPQHRVTCEAPRMGGGFGGKETQGNLWAAIVSLAAWKTRRAVRVQLDRDLDIMITGKRHPFLAKWRGVCDKEGFLQALEVDLTADGGWSLDLSVPVLDRALFHLDNSYYIPNVTFSGIVAKTNKTSNTAFRGFGGPQGVLVIEEIMGQVAAMRNIEPEDFRSRNFYRGKGQSNTTHYGEEVENNRLAKIWRQLLKSSDFKRRKLQIIAFNKEKTGVKRGIAVTPIKFGISFTLKKYNQAGALVLLYQDGTAQVNHGGTEMGQGLNAKMIGVAMRELGLAEDKIRLMRTRTDKVPNTSATAASSGSDLNGFAIANACRILKNRLRTVARDLLNCPNEPLLFANNSVFAQNNPRKKVSFAELCAEAYARRISLSANGFYRTPNLNWNWEKPNEQYHYHGKPFHYFAFGAAVCEVELDARTGVCKPIRVDILHDTGNSLNPQIDIGQIEGGYIQGMGWLLSEDLRWMPDGRLGSHSASTYQIPAFSDAPCEFRVRLLENSQTPGVIHGSKAVGEPPLMLAYSAREAVRMALRAVSPKLTNMKLSPINGENAHRLGLLAGA